MRFHPGLLCLHSSNFLRHRREVIINEKVLEYGAKSVDDLDDRVKESRVIYGKRKMNLVSLVR